MILGALLFITTSTEARMVVTEDHHDDHSSHQNGTNHTAVKNTTSTPGLLTKNLLFVGEGQEGTPNGVGPLGNSTSKNDSSRVEKQYYVPYPSAVNPYGPFAGAGLAGAGPYSPYYNPYPAYYASAIALGAGITGPGNKASSCAYAYPNRRYSCLGLGRRK